MWQGFGIREDCRGGLCEETPEAAPVSEPVAPGSKTDLPLAKAEPIGSGHSASVITIKKG